MKRNYQQPSIQTVSIRMQHIIASTSTSTDGLPSNKSNPGIVEDSSRQSGYNVWDDEDNTDY